KGKVEIVDSAGPDSFVNPPPPPGCDYGELHDDMNDDFQGGTAEATMLTFGTSTVLCGKLDVTHFDATNMLVDIDSYTVDVGADALVIVRLTAPGAEALTQVQVAAF